ncbi:uncharacterized protein LOC119674063 [Teleopsis dalmanni]|uniref:uncharacterized protein LOC119674063 n=1 Tax=Teleopsis dalmanni TaxID=139649 RepID=UPI0018CEA187|nr:uncharacterized protein LOC119674063 [Teleopsis dalmanni]
MRENIVTAVPFEYTNHDQLSTNIDDKQSMAKNNTRPLSPKTNESKELSDLTERNEEEDLEPHERAASCFYGGAKYTHGQKLIRFDPCEVCLCIDGEIFCWWENCDKHPKRYTTVSNNKNMQKSEKTYKLPKSHKSKAKKKKIKATLGEDLIKLEPEHNQKHRQHHKQHERHHKYKQNHLATSQTFSKILNFPENLPSVLYHDYKSEEHQHHQYQHRQQHLKHQLVQLQMRHQQQQQYLHGQHIKFEVTTLPSEHPSTENDNVDIETETDSDILPEPPTKRPKMTVTTIPATTATKSANKTIATKRTSNVHSTNDSKNLDNMTAVDCTQEESGKTCRVAGSAFTPYTTATVVNATQSIVSSFID